MGEMEEKLGAILNNPQMMQQIMTMAQALGQSAVPSGPDPQQQEPQRQGPGPQSQRQEPQRQESGPQSQRQESQRQQRQASPKPQSQELDLSMLQKFSGIARQGNIDKNQQALLKALGPYLSKDRISRLEKAMRAAKMAQFASFALSQLGQSNSGR